MESIVNSEHKNDIGSIYDTTLYHARKSTFGTVNWESHIRWTYTTTALLAFSTAENMNY